PEQFHLYREERYYLRQRRCTQTHCCRQYLHRLQKWRTGPPGHRRHIPEGFSGRRFLRQRRQQLEWIRFEQLLGEQCRVFRHHSAQDTRPRLARLADPDQVVAVVDVRNALANPSLLALERSTALASSYMLAPLSRMYPGTWHLAHGNFPVPGPVVGTSLLNFDRMDASGNCPWAIWKKK